MFLKKKKLRKFQTFAFFHIIIWNSSSALYMTIEYFHYVYKMEENCSGIRRHGKICYRSNWEPAALTLPLAASRYLLNLYTFVTYSLQSTLGDDKVDGDRDFSPWLTYKCDAVLHVHCLTPRTHMPSTARSLAFLGW